MRSSFVTEILLESSLHITFPLTPIILILFSLCRMENLSKLKQGGTGGIS